MAGTAFRLELGQLSIESRTLILALNLKLKIMLPEDNSILYYTISSPWTQAVIEKLMIKERKGIFALEWALA